MSLKERRRRGQDWRDTHFPRRRLGPSPGRPKKAGRGSQEDRWAGGAQEDEGSNMPQGFKSAYTFPVPLTSQRNAVTLH